MQRDCFRNDNNCARIYAGATDARDSTPDYQRSGVRCNAGEKRADLEYEQSHEVYVLDVVESIQFAEYQL